jgi:hypothetical protein
MKPPNNLCKEYYLGKQTRVTFKGKQHHSNGLLDLAHTNLCGSSKTRGLQGDKYFMLPIDDYSRMMWVTFLREKSKDLENLKIFKAMVEIEIGLKLKCLRSNRGGESSKVAGSKEKSTELVKATPLTR